MAEKINLPTYDELNCSCNCLQGVPMFTPAALKPAHKKIRLCSRLRQRVGAQVCDKPKVKCSKCPNRDLLPLTAAVIDRHLRGKDTRGEDVVGVYPMLPDETCLFLVADFDDANWQEDIAVFRDVCSQHGINVHVERSRSGNGGHAWFFFEEAISCILARRLGSAY